MSRHHPSSSHSSVTLRVRVWVEIGLRRARRRWWPSPSVRGCGLKYRPYLKSSTMARSPSVRGCGLKSGADRGQTGGRASPSVRGCGLKCLAVRLPLGGDRVTLRARVWVEICKPQRSHSPTPVTLRARVWVEMSPSHPLRLRAPRHPPCEGVG